MFFFRFWFVKFTCLFFFNFNYSEKNIKPLPRTHVAVFCLKRSFLKACGFLKTEFMQSSHIGLLKWNNIRRHLNLVLDPVFADARQSIMDSSSNNHPATIMLYCCTAPHREKRRAKKLGKEKTSRWWTFLLVVLKRFPDRRFVLFSDHKDGIMESGIKFEFCLRKNDITFNTDKLRMKISLVPETMRGLKFYTQFDWNTGHEISTFSRFDVDLGKLERNVQGLGYFKRWGRFSVCCVCFESTNRYKRCARCRTSIYCSASCQAEDWCNHKARCPKLGKDGRSFFYKHRRVDFNWLDVEFHEWLKADLRKYYLLEKKQFNYNPSCFLCGKSCLAVTLYLTPVGLSCKVCTIHQSERFRLKKLKQYRNFMLDYPSD